MYINFSLSLTRSHNFGHYLTRRGPCAPSQAHAANNRTISSTTIAATIVLGIYVNHTQRREWTHTKIALMKNAVRDAFWDANESTQSNEDRKKKLSIPNWSFCRYMLLLNSSNLVGSTVKRKFLSGWLTLFLQWLLQVLRFWQILKQRKREQALQAAVSYRLSGEYFASAETSNKL